jgi:ABC-2 type transport system ATP-binding protein
MTVKSRLQPLAPVPLCCYILKLTRACRKMGVSSASPLISLAAIRCSDLPQLRNCRRLSVGSRIERDAGEDPEMCGGVAVETRDLTKDYGGREAVRGLDLTIPEGCAFGLLGPNGAGKSTTIQMLLGLVPPTRGHAHVFGVDSATRAHAIRAHVGYVPERHYIYEWMTVADVIWFTRSFYPTWDDALCDALLVRYALDGAKKVKHLSRGMVTKLALLLALAHHPRLLMLDEPTSGLDPLIREEFNAGVVDLRTTDHRTILYSSHIITDIEKVADTIGIIHEGRLLIVCPRAELVARTKRIEATLADGSRDPALPRGVVWHAHDGERCSLTVHGFTQDTVEELCAQNSIVSFRVFDLDLEEIFKDFIKGQQSP